MERSKNNTCPLTSARLVLLFLIGLIVSANGLWAQEERRGAWMALEIDLGNTLKQSTYRGLIAGKPLAAGLSATFGGHLLRAQEVQLGLGFNVMGYGNPEELHFYGMHVDAKYKPFLRHKGYLIRHLQLSARANLPISTSDYGAIDFTTYLHATLSVGWEFPRLIGAFGIAPSIGVSAVSFGYSIDDDSRPQSFFPSKRAGVQTTAFLRLGFIFTKTTE